MARQTTTSTGRGTLGWLRERNRERVVGALGVLGGGSQADIARATGLSRTTVSTVVAELRIAGLVIETGPPVSGQKGGRPGVRLVLQEPSRAVIGIDFGHSHVRVAVADLAHRILAERTQEFAVDGRAPEAIDTAAGLVAEVLAEAEIPRSTVIGAGIGIPGPVDRARGTVGSETILPGWLGIRIAEEIEQRLGLPVEIENDANCGALAELTWGAGRDCQNFAYIKAATGIGAGIVVDGRLLRGASGTAGEIGHTTLDESGVLCTCGNRGCLETVASGPAIVRLVGQGRTEVLTLARVIDLAAQGDVRCRRSVADAGREIGVAVAGLCNLINPERVIVGGALGRAGEILLQPLRESIQRHAVLAAAEKVEVVQGSFEDRAELLGALALVLRGARTLPQLP